MATLTETGVRVVIEIVRGPEGQALYVTGNSYDAAGHVLRYNEKEDVTAALNPTQQTEALDLLNAAEAYLKSKWSIS